MSDNTNPTLELTQALIARPSVTPEDAGCQALISELLASAGFTAEPLNYGDTANLYLRHDGESAGPNLVLLGHTDVVPTGPLEDWQSDPFKPEIRDGLLYGRGAADMKASVAAMVVAAGRFAHEHPEHAGRLSLLLTSDEEGPGDDGILRVMQDFKQRGEAMDYCLVGEPSSSEKLGDVIKIGRRGSLTGVLTVKGLQGHVAYPQLAKNPVHAGLPALTELTAREWDKGNDHFPASGFQIVQISVPTAADNVIPGSLRVQFNFRFNTEQTADGLKSAVTDCLDQHGLDYDLDWRLSGNPFLPPRGKLLAATEAAISEHCGLQTQGSTAGGTSDGRHIAAFYPATEIVEFGPINKTIHQIDECVAVDDLQPLTEAYNSIITRLLLA